MTFKEEILQGIPEKLPDRKSFDLNLNPAPKRKQILTLEEKKLAEEEVVELLGSYDGYWSKSRGVKAYVIGWCGVGIDHFELQIFYDSNNVVKKVRIVHT